jgi:hypothetical protein
MIHIVERPNLSESDLCQRPCIDATADGAPRALALIDDAFGTN